jgi:hypothetical protein
MDALMARQGAEYQAALKIGEKYASADTPSTAINIIQRCQ